ncbi:PEBP-like protein [Xylaria sp. FL1777]|nr:PEBP-like protein [Xylaria sp. FL1777]
MGQESPSVQKILAADATLRLHFPDVTHSKAGDFLTIPQATPTPTLSIAASALKSEPGTKYLVISLDLDPPFPSWPFLGPLLHGVHFDLVAGAPGDDGFAPLQGGSEWIVPWLAPGPPKPSSAHRYVFLAFEQPTGLDAAKFRSSLKLAESVKLTARLWWNEADAEKKLGLGDVLAGNYFLSHA